MERSGSLPASGFDYQLPRHGLGNTGPARKVQLGSCPKDKGTHSSRINQIIRQAEKVPGPGMYLAHKDWQKNDSFTFGRVERTYKSMNKVPGPSHYERKDIMDNPSTGSRDILSKNPKVLYGTMPKGKNRSFLDQACKHGSTLPGAGSYEAKTRASCNRLDIKVKGATSWDKEVTRAARRKAPEKEVSPDQYTPSHSLVQDRVPNYSISKDKGNNFVDKAVRSKMLDVRTKKELPGPGTYNNHKMNDEKISKGTMQLQLRGMSRSAASGYF